jgi:dipeptidyl aminopeptidase/acylaminoacyl peptidase
VRSFYASQTLFIFALVASAGAQTPVSSASSPAKASTFDFTIKNIMRGPELYGREPQRVRWSADGKWIYFNWNEPGTDWRETPKPYRVRPQAGAKPERVSDAQMDSVAPLLETGRLSPDRKLRVLSSQGDLYVVDVARGSSRRLTQTLGSETSPAFSADGRQVYFVRDSNVFALTLDGGLVQQLTDIRGGTPPKEAQRDTGQRGELEARQRELFGVIRDRVRQDSIAKAERKAREALRVKPLYLLANERLANVSVSPNGKALLITTVIPNERALATKVPNYVTESGYTEELNGRTKVGDFQSGGRVAFVSLPSGDVHFLKLTADTTKPPASVSILGWNDAGTSALLFTVASDFKDRWIHTVSSDGAIKLVDTHHDSAWVDGPCFGCGGWYDGGRRFWYVSEADGYAHLYTRAADGSDRQQLTQGKWEVNNVDVSRDQRWFYLTTSEKSPFEQHVYRMAVTGGPREQLTTRVGSNDAVLSPDESMLAVVHSESNRPPELFVMPNRPAPRGATSVNDGMVQLTVSPTKEWLSGPWLDPEIVMIPASDGAQVPARIYRPRDLGAQPNGAAVIFVHGAGYLHNVHRFWSSYSREYMFNHFLAAHGYVVLDIDYRGSAGYGRDWRTAIYRWMGGRDLQDQVDGARYLQKQFGVSPDRIGIYGGSYGGFMTLMALFTEPKWFGAGAALRSVTDWAHYNHGYTARILNFPDKDTLAYRRSSPIFFAQGLEDPLLMAHGMVDLNVHFEDIVRLTQRLIELGKKDWTLAPYPVEDHGFVRPDSWTDEYTRIFDLFEARLAKPVAASGSAGKGERQ